MELLGSQDEAIQEVLGHPENIILIRRLIGLTELVIPDEDSRNKQYREIVKLMEDAAAGLGPIVSETEFDPATGEPVIQASVEIDPFVDKHEIELDVCLAWLNSEEGQRAREKTPEAYLNVRAHAMAHEAVVRQRQLQVAMMQAQATGVQPEPGGENGTT